MADDWIVSESGKKAIAPIMEKSGRPSSFKLAYLQNKEWYYSFIKDQENYRKDLNIDIDNIIYYFYEYIYLFKSNKFIF